jgi:lipocalin-like protein
MNRTLVMCIAVVLILPVRATAQRTAADFVGAWELASIESKTDSGEWEEASLPMTGSPVGMIMYDDLGNMSVHITGSPRGVESPPELPEIVNGYVAYYARYEVDPDAGTVTHHRRGHINPDLADLSVVRYFRFEGDTLTLTVAPERTLRLNWVRKR